MAGKGSKPRPVDKVRYAENFRRIYGPACKLCCYADREAGWCAFKAEETSKHKWCPSYKKH